MSENWKRSRFIRFAALSAALLLAGLLAVYLGGLDSEFRPEETRPEIPAFPTAPPGSAAALVAEMRIGWNLGNSLDAMNKDRGFTLESETFWGNPKTTRAMIEAVKNAGFGAIRIPVSYYNHRNEDGVVDPAWLDRVAEVAGWALGSGLYTVVNVHHDTGMNPSLRWIYADADFFEESRSDYAALWRQIAARFRNFDERLIFQSSGEWTNRERSWDGEKYGEDFRIVHELNQTFIDTVRASGGENAGRYLMISPYSASAEEEFVRAMFYKPFNDSEEDRLILSVHSYTVDPDIIRGGAAALSRLSREYNLPVVVDEIGFSGKTNRSVALTAVESYLTECRKYGFACFFWDDGYEYVVLDRVSGLPADGELFDRIRPFFHAGTNMIEF